MTKLRTIAKAGGWEVAQDANGIVSIHFGAGTWICTHDSAYEAIKNEVSDPVIRKDLLRQWAEDGIKVAEAEAQTPIIEALLGKKSETKDLTEELGS